LIQKIVKSTKTRAHIDNFLRHLCAYLSSFELISTQNVSVMKVMASLAIFSESSSAPAMIVVS